MVSALLPLIMLGSPKPGDVVASLAAGADDYVVHPYSQRELLARVQAVLRRAAWYPQRLLPPSASEDSQQTHTAFSSDSQSSLVLHHTWIAKVVRRLFACKTQQGPVERRGLAYERATAPDSRH